MIQEVPGGIRVSFLVQTKSSKNQFVGPHNGAMKIKICAPPVDGQANEEVLAFLSKHFRLPKTSLSIYKGHLNKNKIIFLPITKEEFLQGVGG